MEDSKKEEILVRLMIVVLSTLAASLCELAVRTLAERNRYSDDVYDRREQYPF